MNAAVIGAGPAGLMAAEVLASAGVAVTVYDHMPLPGRKLLMAGRGGLNLTHSEPLPALLGRYGAARGLIGAAVEGFTPAQLVAWCEGLGQPVFTGSSGRIFPRAMKSSPLLRAWLARLSGLGVRLALRRRWAGFAAGGLRFEGEAATVPADATVLALGGASWPRLGSDGGWAALLPGVSVTPLRPSNCGFSVAWSQRFAERFAGVALKRLALTHDGQTVRGEAMVTAHGIEGGGVYALSGGLRDAIARDGAAVLSLDLRPDLDRATLQRALSDRGSQSMANFLRKAAGLPPVAIGLVQEALHDGRSPPGDLAGLVKALPLCLDAPFPIARAISTAGGIAASELDARFMLHRLPGVFAAGEMLDWEAPTGGYLLQGAFSTGAVAGRGALAWLQERAA